MAKEQLSFQAEVKQLLDLMAHSLYSNREIFLRELISNASDACDKLRFEALTRSDLFEDDSELKIRVAFDKAARTITISDNGIGMSREEVIANIGTIAKSGTREFFQSLTGDEKNDAKLIGQFGVGFYSAFVVADRVTLLARRAGIAPEQAVRWESEGAGDYTLEDSEKKGRGTDVTLHLREGMDDLLEEWRLKMIIRKYSDHISLPIVMQSAGKDETVNQASALWARPKSEITTEQYEDFYKHLAHDFEPPLAYVHAKVEGKQEYTQLLFIPSRAPFDLWDRDHRRSVKLYVRRVFIMDEAEQLLPNYLRFVRGVIDANDLPLNISRELLQESKEVEAIRAGSIKKVLGMIEELPEDKFAKFWSQFGRVMKEGVAEDFANRERIAKLLRFASTHSDGEAQTVSLQDYVKRMKDGQEKIYYITADTFAAAKNSPHLEIFRDKGIEVLLLSDRVDEWLVAHLTEFEGKALASVAKGDLNLGKIVVDQSHEIGEHKDLLRKIHRALGEKVKDVRVTHRLTTSPACLIADENEISGNLARLLKAAGQKAPAVKPILEINPKHPLIQRIKSEDNRFDDWSEILFSQALLAEGGQLEDPASFVRKLNELVLAK
jgi:molecular chaperone HtpG